MIPSAPGSSSLLIKYKTCHISDLLSMSWVFFLLWIYGPAHTCQPHCPTPSHSSLPWWRPSTFINSPAHFISCCHSLLLETSCLCQPHFLFPLTAPYQDPPRTAWPALLWIVANAPKQWAVWIRGWAGPAIKRRGKTVCTTVFNWGAWKQTASPIEIMHILSYVLRLHVNFAE